MESEYDQKFEEMKKYIPFLENMIKRLESSGLSSNPRQAQLDKIRSLRDLLLDKKKRMKMENLLKCEQVLINLYAKVEQRDLRPNVDGEKDLSVKDKTDLNAVRNKLKSIVKSKLNVQDSTETLPEIARASKTEEVCVTGSKEPALFQRRPNKGTTFTSPSQNSITVVKENSPQPSKRNYTRVLNSPETDERRWPTSEDKSEALLFSRRSPRQRTPSYNKKERKKSKQKVKHGEIKDLNITLNVPEESLSSLNTKDILSRIINCSDSDVDINTLRELRSQILGELKHTGSKDDISDLILRSYKKKNINKKNDEMEDGELSDSESEMIKSVYSSIVVLDKEKNTKNLVGKTSDNEAPRKIQICLVINKEQVSSNLSPKNSDQNKQTNSTKIDVTDFENYHSDKEQTHLSENERSHSHETKEQIKSDIKNSDKSVEKDDNLIMNTEENTKTAKDNIVPSTHLNDTLKIEVNETDLKSTDQTTKDDVSSTLKSAALEEIVETEKKDQIKTTDEVFDKKVDIPLLNLVETANKEVASEIDILQALKKEILSETSTALSTDVDTPPLHQPKLTKIVNAVEIGNKKRISIENYKAKSINPVQSSSFSKVDSTSKEELCKKQSLKLTEKECERFNFLSKIAMHDSSDDEDKSSLSLDDIYDNLAPKSPDHEDFADTGLKPPIIIPSDPVDKVVATTESDTDMRKLVPVHNSSNSNVVVSNSSSISIDSLEYSKGDKEFYSDGKKEKNIPLTDPRIKRDVNLNTNVDTSDSVLLNKEIIYNYGGSSTPQRNPTQNVTSSMTQFLAPSVTAALAPNVSPLLVPNMSPSTAPNVSPAVVPNMALGMPLNMPSCLTQSATSNIMGNMTPMRTPNARTYEMTPSRLCMENDDFTNNQHVYTPMFTSFDAYERENSVERQRHGWHKKDNRIAVWEDGRSPDSHISWKDGGRYSEKRNIREENEKNSDSRVPVWVEQGKSTEKNLPEWDDVRKNSEKRIPIWEDTGIRNKFISRDKSYKSSNVDSYQQSYNDRYRYDSRESYNRLECPRTPIHSFGRLDCPSTPTPSFGRSDMPMTPVHSFGRSDYMQRTSTNQYGAHSDPRRTRGSDYNNRDDDRERRHFNDRSFHSHSYRSNQNNQSRSTLDISRQYRREQSVGRYDRSELHRRSQYRESSIGQSYDNDFESDYCYSNRYNSNRRERDYYNQSKNNSDSTQRGYREYGYENSNSGHLSLVRSSVCDSNNSKNSLISVNSNTGKSFTIDVSINKTFQMQETGRNSDNFDARRRRAASVGRTLDRNSMERKVELDKKIIVDSVQRKKENFRRASSVGREVSNITQDFKDVKEDLKSFKLKSDIKLMRDRYRVNQSSGNRESVDETSSHDLHMKKDENESRKSSITRYSPKKNTRDPRMRSDNRRDFKSKYDDHKSRWKNSKSYGIVYSNDNICKGTILGSGYGVKNYKIPKIKRPSIDTDITVLAEKPKSSTSKDVNIDATSKDLENSSVRTKTTNKDIHGTPRATACADEIQETKLDSINSTKNVASEIEEMFSNSDSCETNDKKEKLTDTLTEDPQDNVEKRVTRSAKKKLNNESKTLIESPSFRKTRKVSKSYFCDSDSDETGTISVKQKNKEEKAKENLSLKIKDEDNLKQVFDEHKINSASKKESNELDVQDSTIKNSENTISNTFLEKLTKENSDVLVDDLETFNENLISDPVVDNINALIADLDQDLDVSKSFDGKIDENFENSDKQTNEGSKMTLITGSCFNSDSQKTVTGMVKKDNTELGTLSENLSYKSENLTFSENANVNEIKDNEKICKEKSLVTTLTNRIDEKSVEKTDKSYDEHNINNEAVVSTTEKSDTAVFENIVLTSRSNNENSNYAATPDSTFNVNEGSSDINNTEVLPDSTEESVNITNSSAEISTNFIKENQEPSKTEVSNEIDSLEKLLSLLQDKSKMKELISKLANDTSENEKIKRKLEKLSEIVSDEEENIQDNDESDEKNVKIDNKSCDIDKIMNVKKVDKIKIQSDASDANDTLTEKEAENMSSVCDNLNIPVDSLDSNPIETHYVKEKNAIRKEINSKILNNKEKTDEILSQNLKETESDEKTLLSKNNSLIEEEEKLKDDNSLIEEVEKLKDDNSLIEEVEKLKDDNSLIEEVEKLKDNSLIEKVEKSKDNVILQHEEKNINVPDDKDLNLNVTSKPKNKKYMKKRSKNQKNVKTPKNKISAKNEQPKVKKPSRELKNLQDDIREMFIKDDVLGATGIRMCRLVKLLNEKDNQKDEMSTNDNEPVVVLEKFKNVVTIENIDKEYSRNNTLKEKELSIESTSNISSENKINKQTLLNRPGPKSKTRPKVIDGDIDPYIFETDSVNESKHGTSSESENEPILSQKNTEESATVTKKKMKRKRGLRGWQVGIIKTKNKKKIELKSQNQDIQKTTDHVKIPDFNCFTDKSYCFKPNTSTYSCRLCVYTGSDIVPHYIKHHPHSEIPLSRLCPDTAAEAIKQCEEVNFQAISKMTSNKYTCRFCFKDIVKKKFILEEFFWHVVSMHTGEYKQQCSKCVDSAKCPFNIDIPPPPTDIKGQLLGYICGKCNFTQVSLENLKTHVINRHNDEQTEVYTINLSILSKKAINNFLRHLESQNSILKAEEPRKLRSTRSKQNITEYSDDENITNGNITNENITNENPKHISEPIKNIQSKITFENDNLTEIPCYSKSIKIEPAQEVNNKDLSDNAINTNEEIDNTMTNTEELVNQQTLIEPTTSSDIFAYPHFKVNYTSGLKEYVCCINGNDNHYKTTLLISMKKHVQIKHSENWDGYCFLCKVIVTPQGTHRFKDCLHHYLEKHIDDFPIMDEVVADNEQETDKATEATNAIVSDNHNPGKTYINVRPLSQLVSTLNESQQNDECNSELPVIESVISLGMTEQPLPSPNYPKPESTEAVIEYKYEEAQADIMLKKHRVVLDAMMSHVNLIQIFKCAGKFCSFTTDSAEEALLHASTHMRIGGEHALCCVYCDYDASGNAIDLVTHVFKSHGCCPFVCGICFYRAAASQLVQAHINRVHPNSNASVLRTTVVTGTVEEDGCLPRKTAVPFYRCSGDHDTLNPCKFRTYTPGKFCEHLQLRHNNANEFLCFICSESSPTPAELIRHLKSHGMKLYQCTWCVFGADNETELLEHASAKHPCKQPKAFLRIITNKEGTNEFKVLPLAHLNKSNIAVLEILPNVCVKNPVREAERALELEKLIGETTSMIESLSTTTDSNTITAASNTPGETAQEITSSSSVPGGTYLSALLSKVSVPPLTSTPPAKRTESPLNTTAQEMTSPSPVPGGTALSALLSKVSVPPRTSTPPARLTESPLNKTSKPFSDSLNVASSSTDTKTVTPVIKIESKSPNDESDSSQVVYCLDSDEDNVTENVIDLSEDTASSITPVSENVTQKIKMPKLFKCSNCGMVMKTAHGLMRHMRSCYGSVPENILCAYCPLMINRSKLVTHYLTVHLESNPSLDFGFVCPVCNLWLETVVLADIHFKEAHNQTHTKVIWKQQPAKPGANLESLSRAISNEVRLKRKRSSGSKDKTLETPEKIKKFGPQDIDKLPINPILDDFVYCSLCEFSTKVKLNMVRHLQLHAQQQPVPETAPINPVPHLETNEKHFDKMLNLASSSIVNRPPDKTNKSDQTPSSTQRIAPEVAARYPKFVPERQRHTCGAKGCSYISVDESMLKCHWETLHSGTNDYHCVHCPPYQHLDTSKPLTSARIIAHLKMHDVNLYACSLCVYYHYKRQILEKHLLEVHKSGEVLIVREESSSVTPSTSQAVAAPTMDLKPWHCGLCQFKSLLRPEVVEHCAKLHNSKMQYKCAYCAFRTSNLENIPKHQSKSHLGKPEEIFYYYYREGSIPDEADGTPCWLKQKQKLEVSGSQVKSEAVDNSCPPVEPVVLPATVQKVDLNLVKKEVVDVGEEVLSDLCQEYGEFCEPNGLKYKCPLCKNITEDNEESMQSHLYEELKYRKWGCSVCSYKAFHKAGFKEHMQTEHIHIQNHEPLQLPVDNRIETWIAKLLEHQKSIIEKNKENLAKQKAEIKMVNPSLVAEPQKLSNTPVKSSSVTRPQSKSKKEVESLFGTYGEPSGSLYCCPKCNITFKEENDLRTHLENELNKIRWYCNNCSQTFQTYHEAQFHCKSAHVGVSSRPVEAARDASLRSNWVESAIRSQTAVINKVRNAESVLQETTTSEQNENSLLVVRFEQQVSTPEELMTSRSSAAKGSDNEQLHGTGNSKQGTTRGCPYCSYITTHVKLLNSHVLKHYGLKACCCPYCGLDGNRKQVLKHQRICHPTKSSSVMDTAIPQESPEEYIRLKTDPVKSICLVCRKSFMPSAAKTHHHDNFKPDFGKDGDIVVKCCVCSMLHKEVNGCFNHHNVCHPQEQVDYVFCKLSTDADVNCVECSEKFLSSDELSVHISKYHPQRGQDSPSTSKDVRKSQESGLKRKTTDDNTLPPRKVARKSTAKQSVSFAKKSTAKLPFNTSLEAYSFYGSSQSSEDLDKSILIPFCNTMMPLTVRKLPEIFGNPVVNVEKL